MDITQRIDHITKISDERLKSGVQACPESVKIEVTARCNLRCKFCAVRTRDKASVRDMDLDLFKGITQDMVNCGVKEIGLFYLGESFTSPTLLVECIKWCKSIGVEYTFLTSNATCASPLFVKECMAAGLDSLKWSTNFADFEQFHDITGGTEDQYNSAIRNIGQAFVIRNSNKYKTMLSASSILYEGEQQERMKKFLEAHVLPFVDKHYWLPLYQMSMYSDKIKKEMGYTPTAGNSGRIDDSTMEPTRKPLPCWTAFTEGHVRVDGGLSACCFGADSRFDMGTLDGKNFMDCWNSNKFVALRRAQLRTITEGQKALKGTPCQVCAPYK